MSELARHLLLRVPLCLIGIWLLPIAIFMAGVTKLRSQVFEDPRRAEPPGNDPDYERRFRQFEALGFRPAGMTYESGWFIFPLKWYWHSLQGERWMITADGLMLASFHRLLASEPLRFGVVTLNSGGGEIRTTCPGVGITPDPGSNNGRFELRQVEPAELVARHQENVADFCEKRELKPKPATFVEAAAADLAVSRLAIKKLGGGTTANRLSLAAMVLLPVFLNTSAFRHLLRGAPPSRPPPAHVPHHLSLSQMLPLLLGPIVMLVAIFVVTPLRRRRRILRSHTEDISND